jgi:hypothetical protein
MGLIYRLHCTYPAFSFAIYPFSVLLLAGLRVEHDSKTMLLARTPAAYISLSVCPIVCPLAVLFPTFEVAFISPAIIPGFDPAPLHFPEPELTLIALVQV